MPKDYVQLKIDEASIRNLKQNLEKLGGKVEEVMIRATEQGGEMIVRNMRENHYFVGVSATSYRRAKAGETVYKNPNGSLRFKQRTGNLQKSMKASDAQVAKDGVVRTKVRASGSLGVGVKYAKDVEFGTGKTRAFPFMRPAMEQEKGPILKRTIKLLKAAIQRLGGL